MSWDYIALSQRTLCKDCCQLGEKMQYVCRKIRKNVILWLFCLFVKTFRYLDRQTMVGCKLNLGIEQFGSVQNNTPPPSENMQKIIAFAPIDVMKMITGRKVKNNVNMTIKSVFLAGRYSSCTSATFSRVMEEEILWWKGMIGIMTTCSSCCKYSTIKYSVISIFPKGIVME